MAADFAGFVAQRRPDRQLWGVPVTELWFVDGTDYLGTVIIRHQLTPALERAGGHIGYHVVPGHRRRGHATQMLTQAKLICVIPRTPSATVTNALGLPDSEGTGDQAPNPEVAMSDSTTSSPQP